MRYLILLVLLAACSVTDPLPPKPDTTAPFIGRDSIHQDTVIALPRQARIHQGGATVVIVPNVPMYFKAPPST